MTCPDCPRDFTYDMRCKSCREKMLRDTFCKTDRRAMAEDMRNRWGETDDITASGCDCPRPSMCRYKR